MNNELRSILFLALTWFLQLSCSNLAHYDDFKLDNSIIDTTISLVVQTEWAYSFNYSGSYKDPKTSEELIYSGDPTTHLKVRVFNNLGEFKYDVPLDSTYQMLNHIHCLTMLSNDSIVLLDERGENLFVLDTTGKVVRGNSLIDQRCDKNDDQYEFYPIGSGLTHIGTKLYTGISLSGSCNGKEYYKKSESYTVNAQRYYHLATSKCQIACIDPYAIIGSTNFGAPEILKHLSDVPRETIGMSSTAVANGNLFVFGRYSPNIYQIDTSTLKILRSIPIEYKFGTIGIIPPPISKSDLDNGGNYIRSVTKAYVWAVTYDQPSSQYLVTVCHEVPSDTPAAERGNRGELRNWSLITFDHDFNKVNEFILSGKEYNGREVLSLKNGTWVLQSNLTPQGFKETKIFRRLTIPPMEPIAF